MNWCQPHWDQLKAAIEIRGLSKFVAKDGSENVANIREQIEGGEEKFDPLMGAWIRINGYMLKSPACKGRILICPLCILVTDCRPELVSDWIDGVADAALKYAIEEGLMPLQ